MKISKTPGIFFYLVMTLFGIFYGLLFLSGSAATIRYILQGDPLFLLSLALAFLGALGSKNIISFFRGEIKERALP